MRQLAPPCRVNPQQVPGPETRRRPHDPAGSSAWPQTPPLSGHREISQGWEGQEDARAWRAGFVRQLLVCRRAPLLLRNEAPSRVVLVQLRPAGSNTCHGREVVRYTRARYSTSAGCRFSFSFILLQVSFEKLRSIALSGARGPREGHGQDIGRRRVMLPYNWKSLGIP